MALSCSALRSLSPQVKVLMEDGNSDLGARDRWSLDPLDEAMRERREPVVKYLQDNGALVGGM
ncbi:hypothetical protein COCSUDRAFT_57883 [Coccomyxa subellipsoidea C-169]|uniref:Uncharacterized protein n=1 Tax=Coccomyxa subellipsoidea (strain C-169) TaxID=574566 RepID=I0YP38_COCSC|nr:hypothetical protein COCSUDRAFT_57883 [Coccomyxa subellipsoidea C-169]EIE20157.1 hypothetical protein COCSUDRAFT_57883 [Coccomyxa subellipsoidea C-169]|eukprot:XP_005644701.1 hypothetical protein COCSUDRAFT_57883 [Coccomyxa subellipsoidea C-169]